MHHTAAFTFYEELGVAPDATPEQIRDAFRACVRLVHPDHQTDQQLKEIAERQMRKLNRIYAVLSDPDQRRRYDEVLEKEVVPPVAAAPRARPRTRLKKRYAWIAASILAVLFALWISSDGPAARSQQPGDDPFQGRTAIADSSGLVVTPEEVDQLRADTRRLRSERDRAVRELVQLRASQPAEPAAPGGAPQPSSTPPAPTAKATTEPSPAVPAAVPPAATADRPFTGFWFYERGKQPHDGKSQGLYPPVFIEATMMEKDGFVRGKYRSQYKITDSAISPDVSFEFQGAANGTSAVCPWNSPGGAKGELILKMVGANSMTVAWTTTELGGMGLISGTATLTRRLDK